MLWPLTTFRTNVQLAEQPMTQKKKLSVYKKYYRCFLSLEHHSSLRKQLEDQAKM